MVDTVPFAAPGVGKVINGWAPGAGVMTLVACHACEQSRMEWRIGMTGCAASGERGEYIFGMATGTGQPGVCTGQRKT